MECFSYKGECGIHGRMHIGTFKEELVWVTDKRLWVNSKLVISFHHNSITFAVSGFKILEYQLVVKVIK